MSEAPLISFRQVTKRFPGVVALRNVSIDVAVGELHAIVGENGAGKSTLVKCLSGVITDYEGDLLLRGRPVRFRSTTDAEGAGIGIIHQELNLVDELSAAANIFLGRERLTRLGLLDDRAMATAAGGLLAQLECEIHPRQLVRELRVGDQQLVEIAKALSLDAEILIMDEPTSALTEAEVARLFRVIRRLRNQGVTILYISHKLDEVFRLADRVTVLRDGQLVRTVPREETNPREVTHLMVGREIEETDLGRPRTAGEVVLQVRNLSLPRPGHARKWQLRSVSFSLRRGEILGLAGLMGAGRTELLECLFGSSPQVPQGEILLDGRNVSFRHPAEAMRAGVALVTEDRKRLGIFANLDVGGNISVCTLRQLTTMGLIRRGREHAVAQQSIGQLDVKAAGPATPITSLSGGNQQKAIVGRWLLTKPKILLLDDPTRGVDVGAKAELYRLMDRLCRDGLGIIVTSSELPELLTLCDRILVLCEGHMTGELGRKEATEQRIMELATQRPGFDRPLKDLFATARGAEQTG
ncbi:MAG: sugar ABC transporter ATP-binding protein [Planctomycetota bacterium]|jgi:ABC-type sugar transport system ATPase subunit